jgi:UDP-2-acetamido-2,6-beta-L-arabino-hexul-4-ose reductase
MVNEQENKKTVLVTGAEGFMGRNLTEALSRKPNVSILRYDIHSSREELLSYLQKADVIYHIAGVNRPADESEFKEGNTDFTELIVNILKKRDVKPLLVLSSSVQAALDNPYGKSKLHAEEIVEQYGVGGGRGVIFRLQNVFGKWCRPNYNSAVATFCYNISRNLEITISDPKREVELIYIDDVVRAFSDLLDSQLGMGTHRMEVAPVKRISLEELTSMIVKMRDIRTELLLPDFRDSFVKKLYATYLSFLPTDKFDYTLTKKEDQRGSLAELLKSPSFGQIFVSRTKPGITRGNHHHDTKVEKFCVLEGSAVIRFRHILHEEILSYSVVGSEYRVVDIPPGYTHSIENVGTTELIVLFWSSEPFNPDVPDTYFLPVIN